MYQDIVAASKLDLEQYAGVQQAAFASHLQKYSVDTEFMTASYFRWKYIPPWGEAKVAVVYEEGRLVAATAAIPLRVKANSSPFQGWRIVDIATIPAARGHGHFYRMLASLKESLTEGEVMYSFPNANSTRGFVKLGSTPVQEVPIWIRFVPPTVGDAQNLNGAEVLTDSAELTFGAKLTSRITNSRTGVVRDLPYFKWRYIDHPLYKYAVIDDRDGAFVLFREMEIYGRRIVILLEMWAPRASTLKRLLRRVSRYCQERSIRMIITVTNVINWREGVQFYFFRVPFSASPKRHVLQGFAVGESANQLLTSDWHITMGDLIEF